LVAYEREKLYTLRLEDDKPVEYDHHQKTKYA
jgi:hypothetical protein